MATAEAILTLSRQGVLIRQIARTTGHSRKLVRDVLRGITGDVFRTRQSSLETYRPRLDAERPKAQACSATMRPSWRISTRSA